MVRKNSEHLQHNIKAFIRKGEDYYVAECLEIAVVMQGKTLDETIANLKESVALHLEDEYLSEFGLLLIQPTSNYKLEAIAVPPKIKKIIKKFSILNKFGFIKRSQKALT